MHRRLTNLYYAVWDFWYMRRSWRSRCSHVCQQVSFFMPVDLKLSFHFNIRLSLHSPKSYVDIEFLLKSTASNRRAEWNTFFISLLSLIIAFFIINSKPFAYCYEILTLALFTIQNYAWSNCWNLVRFVPKRESFVSMRSYWGSQRSILPDGGTH